MRTPRNKKRKRTVRNKLLGGKLTLVNTLNAINLYTLDIDGCTYYISNTNNDKYMYVDSATPYLLKFEDDTPNEDPENIENMKRIIRDNLNTNGKPKILTICRLFHQQYNVLYFVPMNCFKPLDLTRAHEKINEMNDAIKLKGLFISLDYVYNITPPKGKITLLSWSGPTQLVLCLNNEEGCIASIGLVPDSDSITINSKTNPDYEGKKYNTLLRCAVMFLVPLLSSEFKFIKSEAKNPISAYLLLQKFDGFIPDNDYNEDITAFLSDKSTEVRDYKILLHEYKLSLGSNSFGIEVYCPVNEETVTKNETAFYVYLDNIT
jgi:hypothetical protein